MPNRRDDQNRMDLVSPGERGRKKVRATFHISAELLDELRGVAVSLSGPPVRLTLSDLAESALRTETQRLRRLHTTGKRFPKRAQELRGGRPTR
jgi:hypothetical protein